MTPEQVYAARASIAGGMGYVCTHPMPQVVSGYLSERHTSKEPPPSPERIREQLGWKLLRAK